MNISPQFDILLRLGISRQGEAGKIVGTGYIASGYILGCSQRSAGIGCLMGGLNWPSWWSDDFWCLTDVFHVCLTLWFHITDLDCKKNKKVFETTKNISQTLPRQNVRRCSFFVTERQTHRHFFVASAPMTLWMFRFPLNFFFSFLARLIIHLHPRTSWTSHRNIHWNQILIIFVNATQIFNELNSHKLIENDFKNFSTNAV